MNHHEKVQLAVFFDSLKHRTGTPLSLNLPAPPEKKAAPASAAPNSDTTPEPVPGNFLYFPIFIELKLGEVVHLGYPKVAIRDMKTGRIRWGSHMDMSWPDPQKSRLPFVIDTSSSKPEASWDVENLLGLEGTISGNHYHFERILDPGKNVVVYSLFNRRSGTRTAYGFARATLNLPPNPTPDI